LINFSHEGPSVEPWGPTLRRRIGEAERTVADDENII